MNIFSRFISSIPEHFLDKVERLAMLVIKILLVLFILSILLSFWKTLILYISFYLVLWGFIPVFVILILVKLLRRYKRTF